jgi:hypothetical protein
VKTFGDPVEQLTTIATVDPDAAEELDAGKVEVKVLCRSGCSAQCAVMGGESRGAGVVSRAGPYICVKLAAAPVGFARLRVGWVQPQLTPIVRLQ